MSKEATATVEVSRDRQLENEKDVEGQTQFGSHGPVSPPVPFVDLKTEVR